MNKNKEENEKEDLRKLAEAFLKGELTAEDIFNLL